MKDPQRAMFPAALCASPDIMTPGTSASPAAVRNLNLLFDLNYTRHGSPMFSSAAQRTRFVRDVCLSGDEVCRYLRREQVSAASWSSIEDPAAKIMLIHGFLDLTRSLWTGITGDYGSHYGVGDALSSGISSVSIIPMAAWSTPGLLHAIMDVRPDLINPTKAVLEDLATRCAGFVSQAEVRRFLTILRQATQSGHGRDMRTVGGQHLAVSTVDKQPGTSATGPGSTGVRKPSDRLDTPKPPGGTDGDNKGMSMDVEVTGRALEDEMDMGMSVDVEVTGRASEDEMNMDMEIDCDPEVEHEAEASVDRGAYFTSALR